MSAFIIDFNKFIDMLRESDEIEVLLDYGDFDGTREYQKVKFAHSSSDSCFTMCVDGKEVLTCSDISVDKFKELVNSLWY